MTATYRVTYDESYCRALLARTHQQRPLLLRPHVMILGQWPVTAIALWLVLRDDPEAFSLMAWILVPMGFVVVLEWVFLRPLQLRRLMRRIGDVVTYTLDGDSVAVSGPNVEAKMNWAAFPQNLRYRDGIILKSGGAICWLPDSALTGATAEEVVELVKSRSTLRTSS